MKKTLTSGITFDASAKTVVHADFSDITIKGIFLVTNITDGIIIYNFADSTKGGTLATDTLTLEYDTTSMDDADNIQVIVDDGVYTQTITGTITANLGTLNGAATSSKQDTIIGHVDGIETLIGTTNTTLGTIDTDTGNISTKIDTLAGAVSGTEMQVDVLSSALPSGAATSAKQDTGNTSLGSILTTQTDKSQFTKLTDGTDTALITASGEQNVLESNSASIKTAVEVIDNFISGSRGLVTEDNSAAIKTSVELIDNAISGAGFNITQFAGVNSVTGSGTATGALRVELPTNGTGTVGLNAGTNAIGKLAANSGVDIGDVDVTSLPVAFNAGTTSATTQRVVKATGSTSTQTQVADSASSGTILAANTGRLRATIVNDSTEILYLRESSSAATTSVYTYKVMPNGTVVIDDYNGALTGIWAANASGSAVVSEVTA